MSRALVVASLAVGAAGCDPEPSSPSDAGASDVGASPLDGGSSPDAFVSPGLDAGSTGSDAGTVDAGTVDGGTSTRPLHIVVIGSSTTYGKNLDEPMYGGIAGMRLSGRWSGLYEAHLNAARPGSVVTNYAVPGYGTFSLLATGTPIPATYRPLTGFPDPDANITRAIADAPDAIIVSVPPGREFTDGMTVDEVMANMHAMVDAADAAGIPIWVTTSYPTVGAVPSAEILAFNARVLSDFGARGLDFFTTRALADGTGDPAAALSDDVHPNFEGHRRYFDVVVAADLPAAIGP